MFSQLMRRRLARQVALAQSTSFAASRRYLPAAAQATSIVLLNHPRCFSDEAKTEQSMSMSGITVARRKGKTTGYCYGCGADLVKTSETEAAGSMQAVTKKKGFWAEKQNDLKKSKLKNWALCPRCQKLNKMKVVQDDIIEALGPDNKMTKVFRKQVATIRTKPNAVVVLCVDAINISGTLIRTIRNYVGGNPILLAVTRCDLLPDYVWESITDLEALKDKFRYRAAEITPADIYLCSEDRDMMRQMGGIQQLAKDLWIHLNGRDPYIVGAANIGKSTLTDILISGFISKGEKEGHFRDRLAGKRLEKLKESRITKSALPGTTLQNVRVPCFSDHMQALWDTPGLLLDESLAHFPIRNLRTIRAQRPKQIQPHIFEEDRKSLALLVLEKGDDLPLLRIEIRLKKSAEGEGPIRLVWNSTLNLDTKIVEIKKAIDDESQRYREVEEQKERKKEEERQNMAQTADLSREEKARRREERRKGVEAKAKQLKAELGSKEWFRRQKERKREYEETKRYRKLAKLTEVHDVVVERNEGIDLAIANLGWLGVLLPRTAMIRTYAPSSGVRVTDYAALALPADWGDYERERVRHDVDKYFEEDVDEDYVYEDYEGDFDDLAFHDDFDDFDDHHGRSRYGYQQRKPDAQKTDIWEKFSGEHVGWQFDEDTRWMKGELQEGWNPLRAEEKEVDEGT